MDLLREFASRPANAELAAAAEAGKCAVVFAGASVHVIGVHHAATGRYFCRLTPDDLAAIDGGRGAFERFVGLEWCGGRNPCFIGAVKPEL